MRQNPLHAIALAILALAGAANTECGGTPPVTEPDRDPWDVRGNYALTYDDQIKLTLNLGGAVRERTVNGYGAIVDFGTYEGEPVILDLREYCEREDVNCPSEAFPKSISISQTEPGTERGLYEIHAIDNDPHELPPGVAAARRGGILNHDDYDRFVIGLEGASGGEGNCGAIALSLAGGRFTREGEGYQDVTEYRDSQGNACTPSDAGTTDCASVTVQRYVIPRANDVDGIAEGKIAVGWMGACAWGPFLAGASLTIETGYSAVRVGPFDPPAFIPLDGGQ